MKKMKPTIPTGAKINVDRSGPTPQVWIEVAPGLSFGARVMPGRWARWWMGKLLDWRFHTKRPG